MQEDQKVNNTQSLPEQIKDTQENPRKNFKKIIYILLLVMFLIGALSYIALLIITEKTGVKLPFTPSEKPTTKIKVEKFASEDEFKAYLSEAEAASDFFGVNILQLDIPSADRAVGSPGAAFGDLGAPALESVPERVSETNVQVMGIDEPDIVKTDGRSLFFSSKNVVYPKSEITPDTGITLEEQSLILTIPTIPAETRVIDAFPPQNLAKDSAINRVGDLLLSENRLIIFSNGNIYGYDVTDRKNPKELWNFALDSGNTIVSSRLLDGKVYVITSRSINRGRPCPIPLGRVTSEISIECVDVYRPSISVPVDTTFNIMVLDPDDGNVSEKVSFVGSSNQSVTYMNPESIYLTYTFTESIVKFFSDFLKEKGRDIVSEDVINHLDELDGYNISETSKMMEMMLTLEKYYASLTDDERRRIENEFENRMEDYSKEHARDLLKTAVVKVRINKLNVDSVGEVPGSPLNQFSLDAYQGNLRIATTSSGNFFTSSESVNDVYVLNENLAVIGSVLDLGLTERIYSTRFVEDKGYLVTFRQIDPFYVIDLSDPRNPKKAGELKIPGFSSYLHPITKDKILGVGRENSQVKISLFDVSNPSNPAEADKYNMDEFWSSIETTHHAFLLDDKHQVFFLPAGQSGYIFSYANNQLVLQRVVSDISAQRAVYIDDYMYIIGDTKIVVLNESDWSEVNSLSF